MSCSALASIAFPADGTARNAHRLRHFWQHFVVFAGGYAAHQRAQHVLLQAAVLAQFFVGRNLYFALALVAQTRAFDFHLAVGQFDLARLRTVPADLPARLARRALPGDLLRAQHENRFQGVDLDFVDNVLHHLAGAFDQVNDGQQDLPVALTELLDHGGRFLGGSGHELIWFLHGGWFLF